MVATITREIGANEIASENGRLRSYVQANVEDRDLGGFVADVEQALSKMSWGNLSYSMTGEYENQRRFVKTMQVVFPAVFLIIFVMLFMVYNSALEAAHVMLAVPFALSGGVFLQKLFGYNFNGAVWVGYIALFGTAVQTGVVMVIYLEEAVDRKRRELGGTLTRSALRDAVVEGALLRLRPKVMTVSTVVAGLLPIMWSTRVGAEVMKPLATPVLGGMVSSLIHVLIVTPVIFFWLRERQLGLQREPLADVVPQPTNRWVFVATLSAVVAVGASLAVWRLAGPERRPPAGARSEADILQRVRAGDVEIILRSPNAALKQGRNSFTLEFRRPGTGALVDVGAVRASANMAMPGMAMSSGLQVMPSGVPGRYAATAGFGMAGAWQMSIEWNGPAGQGTVSFQGSVQ